MGDESVGPGDCAEVLTAGDVGAVLQLDFVLPGHVHQCEHEEEETGCVEEEEGGGGTGERQGVLDLSAVDGSTEAKQSGLRRQTDELKWHDMTGSKRLSWFFACVEMRSLVIWLLRYEQYHSSQAHETSVHDS